MCENVHWLKDENMHRKIIPNSPIIVFGYRPQHWGQGAVKDPRIFTITLDFLKEIHHDRQDVSRDL